MTEETPAVVVQDNAPALMEEDIFEPAVFKKGLKALGERQKMIETFVGSHLKENVDYGPPFPNSRKKCLLKPGAEKACALLSITPEFSPSAEEILNRIGEDPVGALIGQDCRLIYRKTGEVVSHGKGVAQVQMNREDIGWECNRAIKMAQKSAQIDAVLRLGFSYDFTQDMEDKPKEKAPIPRKAPSKPAPSKPPATKDAPPDVQKWNGDVVEMWAAMEVRPKGPFDDDARDDVGRLVTCPTCQWPCKLSTAAKGKKFWCKQNTQQNPKVCTDERGYPSGWWAKDNGSWEQDGPPYKGMTQEEVPQDDGVDAAAEAAYEEAMNADRNSGLIE
jgi:hypothetical protein